MDGMDKEMEDREAAGPPGFRSVEALSFTSTFMSSSFFFGRLNVEQESEPRRTW